MSWPSQALPEGDRTVQDTQPAESTSTKKTTPIKAKIDREVKVVLVGESGVGKTSLALRFITEEFHKDALSTIGASYLTKTVEMKTGESESRVVNLNIWDTAGQVNYF